VKKRTFKGAGGRLIGKEGEKVTTGRGGKTRQQEKKKEKKKPGPMGGGNARHTGKKRRGNNPWSPSWVAI